MLEKLQKHIETHLNFLIGKKVLVACSGGLDSVVLTRLMGDLGYDLGIAHCNFSLRGTESDEDENFVVDLAERLGVPVFTETFDTRQFAETNKMSIQMAARALRYQWFEEIRTDFKYDYVLTAHHANDDLETFLINLSRGTGLRGLTGINAQIDRVVRPLLTFGRDELLNYARDKGFYWREDSSNASDDYVRNALRHHVIPPYKETAPNVVSGLQKTQQYLRDSASLLEDYLALIYKLVISETEEGYSIDVQKMTELPNSNALLFELLHPFGFSAWDDISGLLAAQSGKFIVSQTHRLLKDRTRLLLTEIPSEEKKTKKFISSGEQQIDSPLRMSFIPTDKMGYVDTNTVYVDAGKIVYPLLLRKWQEGDSFQPFGMKGKKKLSKFFKDEKLSLVAKEKIWVLCSDDQIVWVVGHRLDDRFKVTDETSEILKITFN